jgi:predicted TIM-barrel fold metal-dependent hydrolase
VTVPGAVPDSSLPPLFDSYWEPFWSCCAGLGLVLSVHAGWSMGQGRLVAFARAIGKVEGGFDPEAVHEATEALRKERDESPLLLTLPPRRVLWQVMLSGAFDRHPGLKLAFNEIRADWVPTFLSELDAEFDNGSLQLAKRPSEYWQQNCVVTPSSIHLSEIELRYQIGVDQIMFGTDYPHMEGTWPNTWDWIRASLSNVPETEVRMILGENAIRTYGLDRVHLAQLAGSIGPRCHDVLGIEQSVDPNLLEHFHKRAGFKRPADPVDLEELQSAILEDATSARHSSHGLA